MTEGVTDFFAGILQWTSLVGDMRGQLLEEGFTEEQAFELCLAVVKASA